MVGGSYKVPYLFSLLAFVEEDQEEEVRRKVEALVCFVAE